MCGSTIKCCFEPNEVFVIYNYTAHDVDVLSLTFMYYEKINLFSFKLWIYCFLTELSLAQ